ncbi:hypothetical protein HDU82_004818 [Entophlyctis luteolus]|nr:hypothetical protein HDU82_004818 [Entophlyctis luteolus]
MDLPSNAVLQQDAPENLGDSVDPFIASLVNSQLVVDAGALGIDANRPAQLQRPQSSGSAIHMISGFASWVFANAGFGGVLPENTKDRQFAVPLNAIMGQNGERGIPRVVDDCIRFILQNGLETEGLFRISPSQQFVNALHDMYDSGEVTIDIASNGGVHSAAGLLKMFFRELPEPIIPGEMYDTFRMIQSNPESAHAIFAKTVLLPILPQSAQILLRALFHMLHTLHLNKDTTLMPAANLAIVWAPNFVRSTNPMVDLGMCTLGPTGGGVGTFVRVAIEEWDEVFGNTFENFDDGIFVDEDQLKPVADSSETESGPASGSSRPSSGNSALGENRRQGSKAPSQLAKEYTSDTDSDEISSMNFSLSRHDGSGSGSGRSTSVRNSASYDPSRSTVPLATPEEYVSDASGVVRTRTRTIRGKANRGTIVAAEDSSLAMLGAGLSQTTLADASRVGFGGGEKLSLA